MTFDAVQDIVSPSRVLEPQEITAIMSHVNRSAHKLPVPYKLQMRHKPKLIGSFHSSCCLSTDRCNTAQSEVSMDLAPVNNSDTALVMPKSETRGSRLKR